MKTHKKLPWAALVAVALAIFPNVVSAGGNASIPEAKREFIEWTDVWLPGADKDDKPHVLLVGDSVTKGYYPAVEKQMKKDAYVGRLTTSICAGDPAFVPTLKAVLLQVKFDIIHFNNGLHGKDYTETQYREGYEEAIRTIRELQPEAEIVIALTTPLKKGGANATALNAMADARNRIAKKIAASLGTPIDDLNTPLREHPEYHRDTYHYNKKGIELQAKHVVVIIRNTLGKTSK